MVKFIIICEDSECILDVFWATCIDDACLIAKNYRKNSDNPNQILVEIFEIRENYDTCKIF